jgi:hypothetical protein
MLTKLQELKKIDNINKFIDSEMSLLQVYFLRVYLYYYYLLVFLSCANFAHVKNSK